MKEVSNSVVEGSALLDMRELRALGVAGWHIYILSNDAPFCGSADAELPLTELHASAWRHEDHEVLLNAALRGGTTCNLLSQTTVPGSLCAIYCRRPSFNSTFGQFTGISILQCNQAVIPALEGSFEGHSQDRPC